jgi:hypothetical protein
MQCTNSKILCYGCALPYYQCEIYLLVTHTSLNPVCSNNDLGSEGLPSSYKKMQDMDRTIQCSLFMHRQEKCLIKKNPIRPKLYLEICPRNKPDCKVTCYHLNMSENLSIWMMAMMTTTIPLASTGQLTVFSKLP